MAARLIDQAAERVALARKRGRKPVRWIVNADAAAALQADDMLHDLPIERPETRWGLELVCAATTA